MSTGDLVCCPTEHQQERARQGEAKTPEEIGVMQIRDNKCFNHIVDGRRCEGRSHEEETSQELPALHADRGPTVNFLIVTVYIFDCREEEQSFRF